MTLSTGVSGTSKKTKEMNMNKISSTQLNHINGGKQRNAPMYIPLPDCVDISIICG